MKQYYQPKVVMSIHGYKSRGKWQDLLTQCIKDEGLLSAPYKYGYKLFRILPHHINNDVKRFRDWYFSIVKDPNYGLKISEPFHRPSIIAHSLGTWIIAKALMKFPEIKFDKIFLFGSIIPADFDWFKLILNDQVNSVVYERAKKDSIAALGVIFTGSFKPCGTRGFIQKSSFMKEHVFSLFGHSDFNYEAHFREFIIKRLREIPHQLSIAHGRQLTERNVKRYFKETTSIDRSVYPADYLDNEISIQRAIEWFRIEKDVWSFVVNSYSGKVVAYINAMPVSDKLYETFCSGKLLEKDIAAEEIQDYDTASKYNLIILSIAIKKSTLTDESTITKGRIAEMLIMSVLYKISIHNSGKSSINKMAAFAWTPEGRKLCEGFCMEKRVKDNQPFPLYEIDFNKFNKNNIRDANFMSNWWYNQMLRIR